MRGLLSIAIAAVLAGAHLAQAGMPRGVMLSADVQDGDDKTGITIARGDAQLSVEKRPIAGSADQIELNPVTKRIVLSGRASLTVGKKQYAGAVIVCGLDFSQCIAGSGDQPLPIASTTPPVLTETIAAGGPVQPATAVIMPR